ncbi:MAG: GAF domain-containing sensor histidine kinase [Anaerolineales bacterium]
MVVDRTHSLLELLINISREVATTLDLRSVLQRLLFAAIQHVGGERGSIVVMDELGRPVDATIVYGRKFHDQAALQLRDTVERGLAGWVVKHHQPVLVPDTSKDKRWLHRTGKAGAESAICVPLMARKRLVGVLTLVHSVPNAFTEENLELMQAIADQVSVAVLNARLYFESQRTARVMSALAESAVAITSSLEMTEVWQRILNQTMQALQVETVVLALIDHTDNDLVFHAAAGYNSGSIPGRHIPNGQGLAGMVASNGRGFVIPAVKQDLHYSEVDDFEGIEMRAVAIAPIQAYGKVIGVLEAINPASGSFDTDTMMVMTDLGSLAGMTIQNAELFDRLQKAHRHYHELFEDSVDTILITDWEGKILEANRQAVKLSGYSVEQLHSMSIDQLHEINSNKTGLKFGTLKLDQECDYESSLNRQDGGATPIAVYARRVEFEETDSIQWILRDITERKELDALREDMASMIYHDLRSPLGNIVSSLDMMGDLVSDDDALKSMLDIAGNSTARIQRLVNSLLDINRLESGQRIMDQDAVDPVVLIREAIRDVEPAATARQQRVENKALGVLPCIWVDVDMVHRVFINLLENAIKFTPVEGRIEIGAQMTDGDLMKFWVRDNGPGISAAYQENIFDKFTRVRGKDGPGGLGVGLAFCRLAVLGHGGEIWVESEPGHGTTFWLTLPVAQKSAKGELRRQTGRLTTKERK